MALLKPGVRSLFRKNARSEIRALMKSQKNPLLAMAQQSTHDFAHGLLKKQVPQHIARSVKDASPKYANDMGTLFAGALANHAYEAELFQALRKNAKNRDALRRLGIKRGIDARMVLAESRRRLALARETERLGARCIELFPRAVLDKKANAEFQRKMDDLVVNLYDYHLSLEEFHERVERARKRGFTPVPSVELPPGFAG